ncbi:MAG: FHA domain-containing protein [Candidatus Eremiobacteraeota bacterium]|nr:FHA domain-containing protein [Candidatus Eremiobacteraeota bacterium]MBC5826911.1 FHA domain-containing protein [Candidatus Eremiobacteraeota bacterium]
MSQARVSDNDRLSPIFAIPPVRSEQTPRICGRCFSRNLNGETNCKVCGESLPRVAGEFQSAATRRLSPAAGRARLIVHGNEFFNGTVVILESDVALIGRSSPLDKVFPDVDLVPFDAESFVSRRHAFVLRRRGGFVLEDLESVNGTYLSGMQRLPPHVLTQLKDGDEVTFGKTRCSIEME